MGAGGTIAGHTADCLRGGAGSLCSQFGIPERDVERRASLRPGDAILSAAAGQEP